MKKTLISTICFVLFLSPSFAKKSKDVSNMNVVKKEVSHKQKYAFQLVDLDYRNFVKVEKKLYRPSEVDSLLGNCKKAKRELGWKPNFDFKKLVEDMVKADLEFVEKEGY